jgi:hypothetical protein
VFLFSYFVVGMIFMCVIKSVECQSKRHLVLLPIEMGLCMVFRPPGPVSSLGRWDMWFVLCGRYGLTSSSPSDDLHLASLSTSIDRGLTTRRFFSSLFFSLSSFLFTLLARILFFLSFFFGDDGISHGIGK